MNKLVITAVLVSAGFASCYKEKAAPDVHKLLVGHKWYLNQKLVENAEITTECELSQEATFSPDSTGFFYNATPCDSFHQGADSISFRWTLSSDKKNIYFKNVGGNSKNTFSYYISSITDDKLRIGGNDGQGHVVALIYLKSE